MLIDLAGVTSMTGRHDEALRHLDAARVAAVAIGSDMAVTAAMNEAAEIQAAFGDPRAELALALEVAESALVRVSVFERLQTLSTLAICCARAGEHDTARLIRHVARECIDRSGATPPFEVINALRLESALEGPVGDVVIPEGMTVSHVLDAVRSIVADTGQWSDDLPVSPEAVED